MAMHELSALLWRERELLDLLTLKLEEAQFLLTAGKSRWLAHGAKEVEQVREHLSEASLARTIEAAVVAENWGLPTNASLGELAAAAPESAWSEILTAHLTTLTHQTTLIKELRDSNEQCLSKNLRSTRESLADLRPVPMTPASLLAETSGNGANSVFDAASKTAASLRKGKDATVHLLKVQSAAKSIINKRADIGTRQVQLERGGNINTELESTLDAQKILDLKLQETNYQMALAATARVLRPTLMDFLR